MSLFSLLGACVLFMLYVLCCVSDAELVPVSSFVEGEVVRVFAFVVYVLWLMFLALYRALVVWRVLERCCNGG